MTDLTALRQAIKTLDNLEYDELIDLIDLTDYDLEVRGVHSRRKGKTPVLLIIKSPALDAAVRATKQLDKEQKELLVEAANQLARGLAPVEKRRQRVTNEGEATTVARGYVQTKTICRWCPVISEVDGEVSLSFEYKCWGPYLYIRIWAVQGDRTRTKKRLKNKYIGMKGLGAIFEDLPKKSPERQQMAEQIIAAYEAGELEQYHKRKIDETNNQGEGE
jgi:hypothetical protein